MPRLRRRPKAAAGPEVRLGATHPDGVSPSMKVLIERGVERRPKVAAGLRGTVVMRFAENLTPLRVTFGPHVVRVDDGDAANPDLAISGRLPDIIHFAAAPSWGGIPRPTNRRGLAAIGTLYRGRVRLEGDRRLARGLMALLALSD